MAAVSTGQVYSSTEALHRPWVNPTTIVAGTAVISINDQPGIAITGTGDSTAASLVVGPYTITQAAGSGGGVGNEGKEFSAAVDGTWTFPVTGALTTTPNNTQVYAVVSSGDITSLTLTASSNKKYGVVDYSKDYVKSAGFLPVKIGVFA